MDDSTKKSIIAGVIGGVTTIAVSALMLKFFPRFFGIKTETRRPMIYTMNSNRIP